MIPFKLNTHIVMTDSNYLYRIEIINPPDPLFYAEFDQDQGTVDITSEHFKNSCWTIQSYHLHQELDPTNFKQYIEERAARYFTFSAELGLLLLATKNKTGRVEVSLYSLIKENEFYFLLNRIAEDKTKRAPVLETMTISVSSIQLEES